MSFSLIYIAPQEVVRFITANPVVWPDKKLANGPGNLLTPTPGMEVFFDFLQRRGGKLFSQREYVLFAWQCWAEWRTELSAIQRKGVSARIARNFYPSAIDSIHVWGMLVDSGRFDRCVIDTAVDAIGKVDITIFPFNSLPIKIGLFPDTEESRKWRAHKAKYRGVGTEMVDLVLSMDREQSPGGKRWYNRGDLAVILTKLPPPPSPQNYRLNPLF
jgi:hypothetical protein